MSTFDTLKDLLGDVADDYKKAWDDLLDRDEDDKDDDKKKKKDSTLSALAGLPGFAGLPLGTVQALVDAGPAAPVLANLISGGAAGNPLAALTGGGRALNPLAAAANPLTALSGVAGAGPFAAANPLAALSGAAGANPLGAAMGAANPLAALGDVAGAVGNAGSLAETLLALPGQIAQLTDAITKLLSVLPGAAAAARKSG